MVKLGDPNLVKLESKEKLKRCDRRDSNPGRLRGRQKS